MTMNQPQQRPLSKQPPLLSKMNPAAHNYMFRIGSANFISDIKLWVSCAGNAGLRGRNCCGMMFGALNFKPIYERILEKLKGLVRP
jgi:hypothetical protein